jgi:ABC-type branched-subunit amino acid transport system ATPase component/sugar phosphate permease
MAIAEPPALDDLEHGSIATRRVEARRMLGFGGTVDRADQEPLRAALKRTDSSLYPVAALGALGIVDSFQSYAFTVLTPTVMHSLGLSLASIALARTLAFIAQTVSPIPMAALARRGRRAALCVITAAAWSVITLLTGFTLSLLALIAVLVLDGLSTGSVGALHPSLIVDSYPPTVRVRMLTAYNAIARSGSSILSPLFVALLAGPFNLTWRGVFLVMGATSLLTTAAALRLRDPGFGKFDTQKVHELGGAKEERDERETGDPLTEESVSLGFFEVFRRILLIPTIQRLCFGFLVLGVLTIPLSTFVSSYLAVQWGLSDSGRGYFFAGVAAISIVGLVFFGRYAEGYFRASPSRLVGFCGWCVVAAMGGVAIAVIQPTFVGVFVMFAAVTSLLAVLQPGLTAVLLSLVDGPYRPHMASVVGVFLGAGSILGTILLSQVNTEYGLTVSIVSLTVPGIAGGLIIRSARGTIEADLDTMITQILESEDIAALISAGARLPMLSARGVNFSYGQLQVLFDVDFTVDDGEMVALLGTNGAGKSTLLKVISGIGLPQSGTVRYRGHDITYLDAERRLKIGITQIPGGRAVFGPLNVVENLRAFGYAVDSRKQDIDDAIERCFEAFPRLRERIDSPASTLSGGEQQMLGLSKALMLRSKLKLLLIDELSLGLAPIVVGQLLDIVREINASGPAVVLVEQSVNVALSLVDHAYFMEKGEMRFDGSAEALLGRTDLLRAVFLEGAARGAVRRKA